MRGGGWGADGGIFFLLFRIVKLAEWTPIYIRRNGFSYAIDMKRLKRYMKRIAT